MIEKIFGLLESRTRFYRDRFIKGKKAEKYELKLANVECNLFLNSEYRKEKIIVSLTSFPARFDKLHLVIKSIFMQTLLPDEIILYLDDNIDAEIPKELLRLKEYGLQIKKRPLNIKPHKKYYYAFMEYPNDLVVTIDDDVIYPANLLSSLYSKHIKYPDCVVAARAHKIRFDNQDRIMKYNSWFWNASNNYRPSKLLVATGVGGVLYPPNCMYKDLLDFDLFMKLSPLNDDLWLKIMQILNDTCVVVCNGKISQNRIELAETQNHSLNSVNVHENANDVFMNNLLSFYKLKKSDFCNPINISNYK